MADSLYALLPGIAARPSDSVIGWRGAVPVRAAEFLTRSAAWRALLQRAVGQQFALYLDDSLEFAAALLGAWQAGKTVWLAADTLPATIAAMRSSVDGFLGEFPPSCEPMQPAPDAAGPATGFVLLDAAFPALVVSTSGTTGTAQAMPKRLSQLATEVATLDALFGHHAVNAEVVATVSHQHIYGLLFRVLWPLTAARALHARTQNFPEELAALMAARTCILISSPAHLKRLPAHLAWPSASGNLRAVFSSGGPLPIEVAQAAAALLGPAPIEIYGSSESGGIAWRQRSDADDERWQPMPAVTWRIAAETGQLEVRSPHLPDTQWLPLADRAGPAADDGFVLLGRADRIVKIEEKRISLDAIEAALLASPLVAAVRVLVCDEVIGERQRLAAFIVSSDSGAAALAADGKLALNRRLTALLATSVHAVGLPRRWRYLARMPQDAQGKTTRALLLATLDERPRTPQLRLLEQDASRVRFELTAPADLYYFEGHFPGVQILPGVVQIDWAIAIGRQYFDLPPRFLSIHALKFQRVITPDSPVELELLHDAVKNTLNFRYLSAAGAHAGGRLFFGAADV
jgi:acyl-coenzyme A synthetase/AMP-(fatty) acid ligase/3-hydroxymyristoyl/3-hydroxydecanoyl-(acyl carrier protein) dehydratase